MKNIIYGLGFLISGCASNGFNHEITTDKNPDLAQSIQGIKVVTFQLTENINEIISEILAKHPIEGRNIRYLKSIESMDGDRVLIVFKVKNTFDLFIVYVINKNDNSVIGWYRYNNV